MRLCTVEGCGRKHYAHGFCQMHGTRFRKRGTTDPLPVTGRYVATIVNGELDWQHRRIVEKALGKPLPSKAHVHHWDGNGRNNRNGNLVACEDAGYHKLLHRRQRIKARGGNPNTDSWCSACRQTKPLGEFNTRLSGREAGRPLCYCRECGKERRKEWGRRVNYKFTGAQSSKAPTASIGTAPFTSTE